MARKKRAKGEGTIRKRSDGLWEARLSIPGRNPKSFYGKTQAEALKKRDEAREKLGKGAAFDAGKLTFGEYLRRWLSDSVRGSVKEHTFDTYESRVRVHLVPELGGVKLKALTPAHLQGLYRRKLDEGLTPKTVNYIHAVAHRALKQAVKWQLIPNNPAAATDPPKTVDKEVDPLSWETVIALLQAARRHRLEALCVVAIFSGLRIGELSGLRWADVDFERRALRIRQQIVRPKSGVRLDTLKSDAARRAVYLPPQAIEVLKRHRTRQKEEKLRAGPLWEEHDLVFTTLTGKPLDTPHISERFLRPLLKKAGLAADGVRFHDLRHTFATLSLLNGEHPQVVQKALGHATINQTMKTYSHVLPSMQEAAAKRLGELF